MPLYEYNCETCQSDVEILVRSADEQLRCPLCGSSKLNKMLSVTAAPTSNLSALPVRGAEAPPTCGKPQCQSGCMFD